MRILLIGLLGLLFATCAQAQTGTVKTQVQLNTEIGTTGCTQPTCNFPDNTQGLITPFNLRQVNLDLAATMYGMTGDCTVSSTFVITCTKASAPVFQGRITLASGTPVMTATSCGGSPCSAQTTIYYDCYTGPSATYYNGTSDVVEPIPACEVSDVMQASSTGVINASDVFDVWWVHAGANRICLATNGSGAGWSGDTGGSITSRGTGYTQLDRAFRGYLTNANSITHCYNAANDYGPISAHQASYLGTIASGNSAGTSNFVLNGAASGGSVAILNVWNYYNRVTFVANVSDTGVPYTYTSATIRPARNSTNNSIVFTLGVAEDSVQSVYMSWLATAAATNAQAKIGVGLDSTTSFNCQGTIFAPSNLTYVLTTTVPCLLTSGAGRHQIFALEGSDGTNANTFDDNSIQVLSAALRL